MTRRIFLFLLLLCLTAALSAGVIADFGDFAGDSDYGGGSGWDGGGSDSDGGFSIYGVLFWVVILGGYICSIKGVSQVTR